MASPTSGLHVTLDHQGPSINIAVWICFMISGLAVMAKVLTKLSRSQRHIRLMNLQLDDLFLIAAVVFATGQSIAVSQQVNSGLGEHITTLTSQQLQSYEKAGFASEILYVFTLAAAKIAGCLFALNLQPHSRRKVIIRGLIAATGLWTLISTVGIAFQCQLPHTWAITASQCLNQPALWIFVEILNGVTDVALAAILCNLVWRLQTKAKVMLLCVFAARALVIAPIVFRLVHIYQADVSHDSPDWDPTMKNTETAIATAVLMNTSLVLTCVPFLKPLMEALQPGWSTSDVVQGVGYSVMYGKSAIKFAQYPVGSVISGGGARRIERTGGTITRTNNFQLESRSDEGNSHTSGVMPVV